MLNQNVRPAYEVHPFHGTTTKMKCTFNKETRAIEYNEVETEGGFMVYFPKGHSIRLEDEAALKAHGFDLPAAMVDLETGDEVGVSNDSLRRRSAAMTKTSRSGGKEAN